MAKDDSDHEYNEAEDDDYNPNAVDDDAVSSEDDEAKPSKRKIEQVEELDSGDEATIKARSKRRKADREEPDEESGFIRTRAQRQAEKVEAKSRKRGAAAGRVTIDVDSLWSELHSLPVGQASVVPSLVAQEEDEENINPGSPVITIKRKVKFAGVVTEVVEEVARDSEEAQTWLAEQDAQAQKTSTSDDKVQRPLRKISRFEPNPLGLVKGVAPDKLRRHAPSRIDLVMAERRAEEEAAKKAARLTVMGKTALDWKGFVVEQGLGEELKEYGKSKKGFVAREAFLDKVAGANLAAKRDARLKA